MGGVSGVASASGSSAAVHGVVAEGCSRGVCLVLAVIARKEGGRGVVREKPQEVLNGVSHGG